MRGRDSDVRRAVKDLLIVVVVLLSLAPFRRRMRFRRGRDRVLVVLPLWGTGVKVNIKVSGRSCMSGMR